LAFRNPIAETICEAGKALFPRRCIRGELKREVGKRQHDHGAEGASDVFFAALAHGKASVDLLHPAQKMPESFAIDGLVCLGPTDCGK
jgi:hypothetical protein